MLDGVKVNVMKMVFKIPVISNDMIPKSLLPEFHGLRRRKPNEFFVLLCKIWLERMHNVAEIAFLCRLKDRVEMLRKKDISQHRERMKLLDVMQNFAQEAHILGITKNGFAVLYNLCNKNR